MPFSESGRRKGGPQAFQKAYSWQDSLFPSNSLWNSYVCTNISLVCMWNAFSSWEKCSLQKLPVCKKKIGFKRQLWWEQCLREMQLGLEVNWMLYKNVVLSLALYVIWVHVNCIMFFVWFFSINVNWWIIIEMFLSSLCSYRALISFKLQLQRKGIAATSTYVNEHHPHENTCIWLLG